MTFTQRILVNSIKNAHNVQCKLLIIQITSNSLSIFLEIQASLNIMHQKSKRNNIE